MIYVDDHVVFVMPKSREYQFPALSVLQEYVRSYAGKMHANEAAVEVDYKLHYDVRMPPEDWNFFVGLKAVPLQPPELIDNDNADMLLDFREERILPFKQSRKHVAQVYSAMCGIEARPIPSLQYRKARVKPPVWAMVTPLDVPGIVAERFLEGDMLGFGDGDITGCIGYQGWETYLSASWGLPTIEILTPDQPRWWLSKWLNVGYRMIVEVPDKSAMAKMIATAQGDLEGMLTFMATQAAHKESQYVSGVK